MIFGKKVLALSPHTDDAELGAGGTLARLVKAGAEVYVVALSYGTANAVTLVNEFEESVNALGVAGWDATDFPVRRFYAVRDQVLNYLVALRDSFEPNAVLVPAQADDHQDHQVVTAEALRAFKHCTLLGYELPWNHVSQPFEPRYYVTLDLEHLRIKQTALACYRSQVHRPYFGWMPLGALARTRGLQAGVEYAEAFEVMRWIA